MPRNKFPKGAKVKLLMCDDPGCKCQKKYTVGEDATVISVTRKHITVDCVRMYGGTMTRSILFSRSGAEAHMELLELPKRPKPTKKPEEPVPDPLPQPVQYKLPLKTT